jgi:hypothetical protein
MLLRHVLRYVASALVAITAVGCDCAGNLGALDDDAATGRRDGGGPLGMRDECGNGMDDDRDGRIDEDCFCARGETQACYGGPVATVGVGACARGTQICAITGSVEWGHWGDCAGDTRPSEERCDGARDEDCDGAVDEGCPCSASQRVPCDVPEFVSPPCRAGTQTCRDGAWTACEDAVRPTAELCGNDVDDDCDGIVDDPHLCTCERPGPELCGDGIDNDCDGLVDEECVVCTPTAEVCANGLDEDCDGRIDEGVAEVCGDGIDQDCSGSDLPCPLDGGVDGGTQLDCREPPPETLDGECTTSFQELIPAARFGDPTRRGYVHRGGELHWAETHYPFGGPWTAYALDLRTRARRTVGTGRGYLRGGRVAGNESTLFFPILSGGRAGDLPSGLMAIAMADGASWNIPVPVTGAFEFPGGVTATCDYAYYVESQSDPAPRESRLVRVDVADRSRTVLRTDIGWLWDTVPIQADADAVYYVAGGELIRETEAGARTVVATDTSFTGLSLHGNELYWWGARDTALRTALVSGGPVRTLYTMPADSPLRPVPTPTIKLGSHLYFNRANGAESSRCPNASVVGDLVRVPVTGGAPEVLYEYGRASTSYRMVLHAGPRCLYVMRYPGCASPDNFLEGLGAVEMISPP